MERNRIETNREKEIQRLIEKVGGLLREDEQGFIFSTFSMNNDEEKSVMNCINTSDPEKFWLGMLPLVLNMNKICPEDKRNEFRENFIAFTLTAVDECFPSLEINTK